MLEFFVRHADAAQIAIFAVSITTLWAIEHVILEWPTAEKVRHTSVNAVFVLTALPVELALSATCLVVAHWANATGWGLLNHMPDPSSPWVKFALGFIALDLGDYVYHRAMHHVPVLWRFHLVHHTDQVVDSSTTIREHPGESAVRCSFLVLWTFVLGASFELLLLRQAAETVSAIFAHSAVRLPRRLARPLGWLLVTPNLHHVHHHYALPFTDRNFGGVLSIWDRLFATFAELDEVETRFGLDTHLVETEDRDFATLMAMPFATKGPAGAGVPILATREAT